MITLLHFDRVITVNDFDHCVIISSHFDHFVIALPHFYCCDHITLLLSL